MASHNRSTSSSSRALPVQSGASSSRRESSPFGSPSRSFSTARLASPITGTPPVRQIPTPRQLDSNEASGGATPLPGRDASRASLSGPGPSSLSAALKQSVGRSPPRFGSPVPASEAEDISSSYRAPRSNYGSFAASNQDVGRSPSRNEDIEVLRRHLVGPGARTSGSNLRGQAEGSPARPAYKEEEAEESEEGFDSLQLQGGDMTRHIYRYTEGKEREQADEEDRNAGRLKRSLSMNLPRSEVEDPEVANIKKPGGLRREFIRRTAASPSPENREPHGRPINSRSFTEPPRNKQPFVANNFIEFLTLYGHFAGETLDEDDEALGPDEYFSSEYDDGATDGEDDDEGEYGEDSALLTPGKKKRRRTTKKVGGASPGGAALLLLKSFVGTGVLFLPRAFLNGGMLFSNLVLLAIAALSFWCFILLCNVRLKVHASFGDMGGRIYGKHFRNLINFSLVLSQIGFSAAYIVFVAENLQAFVLAVTKCRTHIDMKYWILIQAVIFLPISLYRNINNIQKLALIADLFIALGLVYLYYYDIFTLATHHGIADIKMFNPNDWTLFIGTAIFTFEGIGLIIPIQSGMRNPEKFPKVLGIVMVVVTVVMVSIGALSYAAYGSATKTVILLNMPQDNKLVNGVQFIYSLAILFSTPLQIYPAIEITSQQLFSRTGKYNPWIKWKKNIFRFFMVLFCAAIAYAGSNDLDKFVAIVGSFACVPLVYIYPPLMDYRVSAEKKWQKISDIALVIFGFLVMGYTTALTVISWMGPDGPRTPGYCDDR